MISFKYSGHFAPYSFAAAALALAAYGDDREGVIQRRAALASLIAGTLLTTVQWGSIPLRQGMRNGFSSMNPERPSSDYRAKARYIAELVAMIPPDAILASSDRELPHVSNRLICYTLMEGYEGSDYILYVLHTGGRDGGQAQKALDSGQYEEIAARPQLSLLRRKGAPGSLPIPPR